MRIIEALVMTNGAVLFSLFKTSWKRVQGANRGLPLS